MEIQSSPAPHFAQRRNVIGHDSATAEGGLKRSQAKRFVLRRANINCALQEQGQESLLSKRPQKRASG